MRAGDQVRKRFQNYTYGMNSRISHESSTPVFLGVNETNGEKVAIKVIDIRNADKTLLKAKEMEADAMRKLRHPNIIYYYDTFSTVNNCYVVMELCEEGDLKTLLQKRGKLKLEQATILFYDLLRGFEFMLKWDYLHCDLKPSNLLLKNSILKVSDFSSCRKLSKTDETTRRILLRKKSVYRSPEMLAEGTSSIKSEIWSLGLILYQMLHGKLPWDVSDEASILQTITTCPVLISQDIPEEIRSFLKRSLEISWQNRMDNKELLAHPFVRKMLSEDEREKHIITHYPSSNGPTQQLSSLHRTEKQLACQLNWMRYLFRLQGMIADEERVDARLLRFIILKQMFTQLHSLTEALNGRNPYFFANWNNFLKEFDKVKRYDEILKNYAARYESLRQLYADLEGHLAGRRELEGIREDFELAEAMSIMAVVISVREIRRMCELIRGERILAKALEVAKVLDFVVTYYQLNCLLVDDFRRIDYFEDRSKLDIIIEGLAVEMDAKAMGELLEKINYIGLLEDARHLGIH